MLSTFGYTGADHMLGHKGMSIPTRGRNKARRIRSRNMGPMFKSATSGFPRTSVPCGSIPAPTIDQVRARERKYGQKIWVKLGLMYFASDMVLYTKEEALRRQQNS
jgi:hypothetical protein